MVDIQALAEQKAKDRARAKYDYFFLANEILGYDFQPCHAELFACFLQYKPGVDWVSLSAVKDCMILWSRSHYKTTAVVVAIIMAILNFPNIRILIMQGSLSVTQTLLKQVLAHFTGEAQGSQLSTLFPEFCGDKRALKGSKMQFTTTARTAKQLAQATVSVASPKSVKTGQHYDLGFFDDLMNDQNYRHANLLVKVREDFTLAQALIDPGCYRFISGTRYAFGDLYEEILRWQGQSGKWIISIRDCWLDSSLPDDQKVPRLSRFTKKNGQIGGFTREELLQMQQDDPANFAMQYLLKPIAASQQAFTKELFYKSQIPFADTPELSEAILVIDLASSDKPLADDSVIQIGRIDSIGVGYLCDQAGGQWQPMETANHVIAMSLKHRPRTIYLEKSASGMIFKTVLEMTARQKAIYLTIEFIPVDNKDNAKNMRVWSLAGAVKRGVFKFIMGLPKFDRLIEQGCEFPKGRHGHDDYIDTAALLYQKLGEAIIRMPVAKPAISPILAMIADREKANAIAIAITQTEGQVEGPADQTGFE